MNLEKLYQLAPYSLQRTLLNLVGSKVVRRRFGPDFLFELSNALERLGWNKQTLDKFRAQKLSEMFVAAENSQFWKERFDKFGIDIHSDNPFEELRKLPILKKFEVQEHTDFLLPQGVTDCKLLPVHTSGTTGAGLTFLETMQAEHKRWATWWRYRFWHGIKFEMRSAYFGGRTIISAKRRRPPYWHFNSAAKQLMFSAFHLNENTARCYVQALNEFKPYWLHGYPSFICSLSNFVNDQNLKLVAPVQKITTGAESLLLSQKTKIKEAFGVEPVEHYGLAENVANISMRYDNQLYVDEDFSIVEFIPIEGIKNQYKIIGTNLINHAFPLFRYDTGDIATINPEEIDYKGWPGRRVERIDGRIEDNIILPDGTRIGRLDHIFKDLVFIREAQIVQNDIESLIIRVVKADGYDKNDQERSLRNEVKMRIGNKIKVKIEYVEALPRTRSGKLRLVLSKVEV